MTDAEAVARAIYETVGFIYGDEDRMFQPFPWEEADDPIKLSCLCAAKAAITALTLLGWAPTVQAQDICSREALKSGGDDQ